MSRLFQITEDDLADLERIVPDLADALATPSLDNAMRVRIRRIQKVLSDVRWNYGPPAEVDVVPVDDQAS